MKILVTGANGLLGQSLLKQLLHKKFNVVATGRGPQRAGSNLPTEYFYADIDITDGPAIEKFVLEQKPSVIVHAAAMTQVDLCELNKQECYNINVTATRFIIDAAKQVRPKFIFVSTDFIFDGSDGPYNEDAEPDPVNYYGSTKMVAEKAVMESGLDWAIARTILVYGIAPETGRTNILGFIKDSIEAGKTIRMVNDQVRTPTYVEDLAKGIVLMIEKNATGIFNISGEEKMTPYDMAIATARYFGLNANLIQKSTSSDINQPAVRPPVTGFNISKAKKELGYKPVTFAEALREMFGAPAAV
jgi:dTDP-4-dehydrorhamnose reductase